LFNCDNYIIEVGIQYMAKKSDSIIFRFFVESVFFIQL